MSDKSLGLFDRVGLWRRLLGRLLSVANRCPAPYLRDDFYILKRKVLTRWGWRIGCDVQHIAQTCRHCDGTGLVNHWRFGGDTCWSCNGTGIWAHKYWLLARWQIGAHVLHTLEGAAEPVAEPDIEGRVEHAPGSPKFADLAAVLVALLTWHPWFLRRVASVRAEMAWDRFTWQARSALRPLRILWAPWRRCPDCGRCLWTRDYCDECDIPF